MTLLAFNTILPQSMRAKYQWLVGTLPIGLMFAAILPLYFSLSWFEQTLGIPPNSPTNFHPNEMWLFVMLISAFVLLMLLGYGLGWVANAVIARYALGWSSEKVRAVFLCSDVPIHWLKTGASGSLDAKAETLAKWESQRKGGAIRFIVSRGILAWGGPMFFMMYVLPTLNKGQVSSLGSALFNVALWAAAGTSFGAVIWFVSESNYRKLKDRD